MLFLFGGLLIPYLLGRFQFRHFPSQNWGRAGELAGGLQSTTKALSSELSREMGSKTRLLAWEMGSLEGDQSLPVGSPPAECYQPGSSTAAREAGRASSTAEVGGRGVGSSLLPSAAETHHGPVATLAPGVQSVDLPAI